MEVLVETNGTPRRLPLSCATFVMPEPFHHERFKRR